MPLSKSAENISENSSEHDARTHPPRGSSLSRLAHDSGALISACQGQSSNQNQERSSDVGSASSSQWRALGAAGPWTKDRRETGSHRASIHTTDSLPIVIISPYHTVALLAANNFGLASLRVNKYRPRWRAGARRRVSDAARYSW
jgi:hypothetical protein